MTPEERKERYDKAVLARETAKKSQGNYTPMNIPEFQYVVLTQNSTQVLRLVGNSLETRSDPTDPLLIERSLIQGDDGSYFTCIWSPDKDWPLRKLLTKLAKYEYDVEKKEKTYTNSGCPLLLRFLTNNIMDNPFNTGMLPKKFVLWNAIDRKDTWCKDNKHTKMLAWDLQEKDGKTFYSAGITQGMYKDIWYTKCSSIGKHFDEVDFVIHRYSSKTRPSEKTNSVIYWEEEKTSIGMLGTNEKKGVDYNKFIVTGLLTPVEESYTRYSLEGIPFISQTTPAAVILNKLGKFLKEVDTKYNTTIVNDLTALKVKELENLKSRTKNTEKDTFVESHEEEEPELDNPQEIALLNDENSLPGEVETAPEVEVEAPVASVKKVTKVATKKTTAYEIPAEAYEHFGGLDTLSDEDKKKITNVNMENDTITFSEPAIVQCGSCELDIPDSFSSCPYCGASFE